MDNGSGMELVNAMIMGLAAGRGLGTGSWRGYLVLKKGVGECSWGVWKGMRAPDTDSGEDEWFRSRAWYTWFSGVRAGIPLWRGLGSWGWCLGKDFVNGVQGLGHGIRGLEWQWRGRRVCKGGPA